MTTEETLAAWEAAVAEWEAERWRDDMRFCRECSAWVNRHLPADVVRLCPKANLCGLPHDQG